jgi:hypothetical protein
MLSSERNEKLLTWCFNVVNYPIKQGVVYEPNSLFALRRMQELCSFGASAAGAVLGARYGAGVSFAAASSGFIAGNIVAGILFKPTPV